MSFLARAWSCIAQRATLKTHASASPEVVKIPLSDKIEEETLPDYSSARYYPVQIGEVFVDRYQVIGKLGFGITSTVWLALDWRYSPFFYYADQPPHELS